MLIKLLSYFGLTPEKAQALATGAVGETAVAVTGAVVANDIPVAQIIQVITQLVIAAITLYRLFKPVKKETGTSDR